MCIRDRESGGCPTFYMRMIWFCVAYLKSLRGLVERFGRVCKRRGLKVNVDKSKVMVVSEDSPQCEVMLDSEQLEQVSEFKYLGYMLDEKGTDDAECSRKVVNGRKVAGAIKSLVNVKGLSLECARVLHEGLLLLVLMYSSCLLYTSDAADERSSVDLGGRRIIKKKKNRKMAPYKK